MALGWPAGFAVGGNKADTTVKLTHEGSGKPWVTFTSKAAVPVVTGLVLRALSVAPLATGVAGDCAEVRAAG